jgi:3-dehydroshikimate dehydratase
MGAESVIKSGLVSVTFREKTPAEIVALVKQAGLDGIEWGGDIHVPHGNLAVAREVALMTRDAGLGVAAYGSYYRVAVENQPAFEAVVDTASELGAPTIRVWAGNHASADADSGYRALVVGESRRIAEHAAQFGKTVSFEFHGGTLTDTNESARWLIEQINHPAIRCYWQPPLGQSEAYCLEGLHSLQTWLSNVHVFQWDADHTRHALIVGASRWLRYLDSIGPSTSDHYAMLEFVNDDSDKQFLADACTLTDWIKNLHHQY